MAKTGPLAIVLLALALVATPAAAVGFVQVDVPTDSTAMDARVAADGDATWTITYRVELSTEDRRAAFEDLEADLAANESAYLDRFRDRMTDTLATAEETTGRSMELRNLSVSTSRTGVPDAYGLLTYRFEWTNFARVDGDRVHAGDALAGLFLDEDTSLTMGWPEGYERASASPSPTATGEQSVTWRGPQEFGPGEPALVVEPASDGLPLPLLAAGMLAALAALGGAFVWRRGRSDGRDETTPTSDGTTAAAAADAAGEEPPDELLSNEERVLKLLESEGGRIKQQAIAERLEWTDAKTSQVVGDLREAEKVETFRLGRENVVTLPGHDLESD
jgi:hypothetical protein